MKKVYYMICTSVLIIMASQGCKKPYLPGISAVSSNYLVVEGIINTGSDSISIRLSRAVPLSSTTKVKPELGANLTIVSSGGGSYQLSETGKGYYKATGINSNSSNTYSLKIVTSNGKVYQSDFVPAKISPPIDSVYYRIQSKSTGLNIFADTHDPSRNSTYYRWEYQETYLIHSAFFSTLYLQTVPFDTVLTRSPDNQIYTCWVTDSSSNILLNSSAKLSKDVIAENLVTPIASTSEKIGDRYSILVKQYVLTADAFNYYQQLKKNSEQLGSIFDAQPSELPGNIHCVTTPSEAVIGFITAGSSSQTRIFIDNRDLPAWPPNESNCGEAPELFKAQQGNQFVNNVSYYIYSGQLVPISAITQPGSPTILGYMASTAECVDCTLRGSNKQPSFWTER
jgi:Domain of unknown function (DUF4249)